MKYELYSCRTPDQIHKDSDMEVYDPETNQITGYQEAVRKVVANPHLNAEQRTKVIDELAIHAAWAWGYKLVLRVNDDGSKTVVMQNDRRVT